VLAITLGPAVAVAQGVGTVTTPSPLVDPAVTTPRVIEGSAPSAIPLPAPVTPPTFPNVIPVEPAVVPAVPGGPDVISEGGPRGRIIELVPDQSGLAPDLPPGPVKVRPGVQVARKVGDLIEVIQEPEAELTVSVGHTKLLETRDVLTRIAIANPAIADLELLSDQPNSRFRNG
jgi:pilus assembly protein CpaC